MAEYGISGIWKDNNGVITHYALHRPNSTGYYRAEKKTKSQVLSILDSGNTVKTWVWNYGSSSWKDGQTVHSVGTGSNRYLRTDKDNTQRDNLDNLIDAEWFLA